MTTPEQSPLPKNGYVLDPESATEMARLMLQDRLINEMIGGLFPEREGLEGIDSMLDIGCGPGGWALDVARSYPKKEITAIDISDMMLTYAHAQKKIHKLENVHFKKMDAREKLAFADQSFDLVNIRIAAGYVSRRHWPLLLKECVRITKAGGVIRLSECDRMPLTNSASYEKYAHYWAHFLAKMEYGFGADTYTFGMSPLLGKLLQEAGYSDIHMKSYALDFSYGTEFHAIQVQNTEVTFKLFQPRLIQMGIATQEDSENLCEAMMSEMKSEMFCGISYLLTFWGKTTTL